MGAGIWATAQFPQLVPQSKERGPGQSRPEGDHRGHADSALQRPECSPLPFVMRFWSPTLTVHGPCAGRDARWTGFRGTRSNRHPLVPPANQSHTPMSLQPPRRHCGTVATSCTSPGACRSLGTGLPGGSPSSSCGSSSTRTPTDRFQSHSDQVTQK